MAAGSSNFSTVAPWMGGGIAVSVAIGVLFPPAFWLSLVGAVLFAVTLQRQGHRTGQSSYVPWRAHDWSLTTNESRFGALALTLIAVPLLVAGFRAASG